ncbi:MAG: hypothetical protein J1E57_02090 [Prevotella sp.]|nr:hypothetical protein [Prevotella sp.]
MKNLYVKFIMVLTMIWGITATVSADEFTPYDNLSEAVKELIANRDVAGKLLEDGDLMNDEIKAALRDVLADVDAVLDSSRINDLDEVNQALERLLNAIRDAQKSVEEYKDLSDAIKQFVEDEKGKIDDMLDKLSEEYGGVSNIPDEILDAIEQWMKDLDAMLKELLENGASQEMLDAFNKVQDMRDVLKAGGYNIPELEDVVAGATGITSVTTSMHDNSAEYGLNGNMVSGNYKGIVIKNGKKFIKK